MSRAHVQGYDSNPAQFERMGNPWLTERERVGEAGMTRKRLKRLGKFPKPDVPTPERKPARSARSDSAAMEQSLRSRRFMAAFKSGLPGGTRTVAEATDPLRVWEISQHPNAAAKRIAAEEAFRVSEAGRAAEKARVKALIKALEGRLASLG
jgi:hypothetical protein